MPIYMLGFDDMTGTNLTCSDMVTNLKWLTEVKPSRTSQTAAEARQKLATHVTCSSSDSAPGARRVLEKGSSPNWGPNLENRPNLGAVRKKILRGLDDCIGVVQIFKSRSLVRVEMLWRVDLGPRCQVEPKNPLNCLTYSNPQTQNYSTVGIRDL